MNHRVQIDEIEKVNFNDELSERLKSIEDLKGRINTQISNYNKYVEVREKIASTSDEYLHHSMIGKLYNQGEFRVLLIKGCENHLESIMKSIKYLESELDSKMWVSPESIKDVKVTRI